jgi:hypothetical protein
VSFDSDEIGATSGRPVFVYAFVSALFGFNLTSYDEDVVFGGITFTSTPIDHGEASAVPVTQSREMTVILPVNHALCTTLRTDGIMPRGVELTISTFHNTGGAPTLRQVWRGEIASIESDDYSSQLRIPASTDDRLAVKLPVVTAQRQCPHMLYDAGCAVSRVFFSPPLSPGGSAAFGDIGVLATVTSVSGTAISINFVNGKPDGWFKDGEIVAPDGERRSILSQTGTALVIDYPFRAASLVANVSIVQVWAGCDHTVEDCDQKFGNMDNFGGAPDFPETNPTAPTGLGVIES